MTDEEECILCGRKRSEVERLTALMLGPGYLCNECEEEQRRDDELIAATPCCVCGRFMQEGERSAAEVYEGQATVWCSDHVAVYDAELRAMIERSEREFWQPASADESGETYQYLFVTTGSGANPEQAGVLAVEPHSLAPDALTLGMPLRAAVALLREAGWQSGAFWISSGRAVNRFQRRTVRE